MNLAAVDPLSRAVLYEGHVLYPYRPATKNEHRFTFGTLYPRPYAKTQSELAAIQNQCLIEDGAAGTVEVVLRFLHLVMRTPGELDGLDAGAERGAEGAGVVAAEPRWHPVPRLQVDGQDYMSWQETVEREVRLGPLALSELQADPARHEFQIPARRELQLLREHGGQLAGVLSREQQALAGAVELWAEAATGNLSRLTIRIVNLSPLSPLETSENSARDPALARALLATQTIVGVSGGQFVSLIDPPEPWQEAAARCQNQGGFPVLVGEPGSRDLMLCAPIILYDYPRLAPESPGDLFDSSEIDEILTLRVRALGAQEKRAAAALDAATGELVARSENLTREQLLSLHGVLRQPPRPVLAAAARIKLGIKLNDRVRLRPHRRADVFDLVLRDKLATISAIEEDQEGRIHVAVTLDDDPGSDLGLEGKPGHRFFFAPDELELLVGAGESTADAEPSAAKPAKDGDA